jgi:hypothetical protein
VRQELNYCVFRLLSVFKSCWLSRVCYLKDGIRYFIAVRRMGISLRFLISYRVIAFNYRNCARKLVSIALHNCHVHCKSFSLCVRLNEGLLPHISEKVGTQKKLFGQSIYLDMLKKHIKRICVGGSFRTQYNVVYLYLH